MIRCVFSTFKTTHTMMSRPPFILGAPIPPPNQRQVNSLSKTLADRAGNRTRVRKDYDWPSGSARPLVWFGRNVEARFSRSAGLTESY